MLMTMTMTKIMMMLMTMTMMKIMMMQMRACARCDLSRTSDLQDCICPTPRLDFPIYPHDHQDGDDQDDDLYHSDDHDDDSSDTRAGLAIVLTVLVSVIETMMKTSIIERCSVAKTKRWRRMLFPSHSRRSPNLVAAMA